MQDVLERFFAAESNVYLILQLKSGPETRNEQLNHWTGWRRWERSRI